jgi:hypothetical protein
MLLEKFELIAKLKRPIVWLQPPKKVTSSIYQVIESPTEIEVLDFVTNKYFIVS